MNSCSFMFTVSHSVALKTFPYLPNMTDLHTGLQGLCPQSSPLNSVPP